jgi:hypothetical protein
VGRVENAHFFVITNRGCFYVRASSKFANLHFGPLFSASRKGFDLKLTLSFSIQACR